MTKKLLRLISFYIKAGEASTAPPIGPLLGQFPLDVRSFCNAFNAETKKYDKGLLLHVHLKLYVDNTFKYKILPPPISFLCNLSAVFININNRDRKCITLLDVYKIVLIINKKYNFKFSKKILFKNIIKQAKKLKFIIIENLDKKNITIYL